MRFKADPSFLRFLTMGARGTKHVIGELEGLGFQPIELERHSTSNKIWSTKIKRFRLPDLLCVKTGLRVEVRAKASLEIRMSHASNNPDRHWDVGLRSEDVVALIACREDNGTPVPTGTASFFGVDALREAMDAKRLSSMKAANEGSEQYLTWPSIVSSRPGTVLECDDERLAVEWGGDGDPSRRHTYGLKGKRSYVRKGQTFVADTAILAGTPASFADLGRYRGQAYLPLEALASDNVIDRYGAAKAIAFRPDVHVAARPLLERMVGTEGDKRLALEVAGAAAALGIRAGMDYIHRALWNEPEAPMQMEAAFITTEVGLQTGAAFSADELTAVAADTNRFAGHEIRQAAIWGLGRSGLRAYERIPPFLADADENVALHAIAAFGPDTPGAVVRKLVSGLRDTYHRRAAAHSEALRLIASNDVLHALVEASGSRHPSRHWVLATLGRLPESMVREALIGDPLLDEIAPLLLVSSGGWLSSQESGTSLRFLTEQIV